MAAPVNIPALLPNLSLQGPVRKTAGIDPMLYLEGASIKVRHLDGLRYELTWQMLCRYYCQQIPYRREHREKNDPVRSMLTYESSRGMCSSRLVLPSSYHRIHSSSHRDMR